jgi:putative transposase
MSRATCKGAECPTTTRKTFKYRLFTNANQERELEMTLETHRRLYNAVLDGRQLCWETAGVVWSFFDQSAWFTVQRKSNPYYAQINAWSAQQTLRALDRAFKAFFARIKRGEKPGYPRFKSKDQFNSFRCNVAQGNGCKIVNGKLRLQYIGTIRVKWHREIPAEAKLKQATILRENGKWYVCFVVELPKPELSCGADAVGVDVGLKAFVTTSDGEQLGDSRILERNLKELRRRQRALSRCKRGSSTRKQVKKRVTTLHTKVRNARLDMHHKVARVLVNKYRAIAVERLNIQGMLRNGRLSRRIADAGWYQFVQILSSKAESAGCRVVLVDPKNTSQECSQCGRMVPKSLSVRTHRFLWARSGSGR